MAKMQHLVAQIARFEQLLEQDAPLKKRYFHQVYHANQTRYQGYTIRQLCQEMHDMYVKFNVKQLQKRCSVNHISHKSVCYLKKPISLLCAWRGGVSCRGKN